MGGKSGNVAALPLSERMRIDPVRVLKLRRDLGDAGAAQVMQRAVEGLASDLARMGALRAPCADGTPDAVPNPAAVEAFCRAGRRLARLAAQVGLTRIARVAEDVVRVAITADRIAAAATWARLLRLCGAVIGAGGGTREGRI